MSTCRHTVSLQGKLSIHILEITNLRKVRIRGNQLILNFVLIALLPGGEFARSLCVVLSVPSSHLSDFL